jgi:phosphoglycolate phosphatase
MVTRAPARRRGIGYDLSRRMKRYRLVIFDFDGTLADTFPWFTTVFNEIAGPLRIRRIVEADVPALRAMGPRAIMQKLGVSWWKVPVLAYSMRRRMAADIARLRPFAGVPDMLRRLADDGLTLAVVTSNAEQNVRTILGESAVRIRHWQCRASMFGKAARFRAVTRAARMSPGEVLCVGDELRDADAARAAGMDFAAVTWGYATEQALRAAGPALVFDRVDDIVSRLARRSA